MGVPSRRAECPWVMISSPALSPDSISIFSASTRPITTGRRSATFPAATTTTGCFGSSLQHGDGRDERDVRSLLGVDFDAHLRAGRRSVGVSNASVISIVVAPVSGRGARQDSQQVQLVAVAHLPPWPPRSATALALAPTANRVASRRRRRWRSPAPAWDRSAGESRRSSAARAGRHGLCRRSVTVPSKGAGPPYSALASRSPSRRAAADQLAFGDRRAPGRHRPSRCARRRPRSQELLIAPCASRAC